MSKKEKLNETALIKEIEKLSLEVKKFNRTLIIESVGDDCAIIKDRNRMLVSSDSITENVHFTFDLYDFYDIGIKSLSVNLSDIAAMGGIPRLFVLSLFIPQHVSEDGVKSALQGIIDTAKKYRVSLVGGNISRASEFTISITIIGDYKDKNVIRRHNSKSGDKIYVSGEIGNSWLTFYLNKNKNFIYKNKPGLSLKDQILIENFIARHKLPEARINLGRKLSEKKLANSLTDVSDGLAKDISNVIGNGCGYEIYIDEIPLNAELKHICKILNIPDYVDRVISFGEDYELLWTAKEYSEKELKALSKSAGVKIKKIGNINSSPSCKNFIKDGIPYSFKDFTFRHI